jgi:hypothetical protein
MERYRKKGITSGPVFRELEIRKSARDEYEYGIPSELDRIRNEGRDDISDDGKSVRAIRS